MLAAWGDESGSSPRVDPGVFLLGAVIMELARAIDVREQMTTLRLPGEKKVHWSRDSRARRATIVRTILDLPVTALVVVRRSPGPEPPERQRRKCFEHFAIALDENGCAHLTMESRGGRPDALDRAMLDALRASRALSPTLRMDHRPGPEDPVLWVADAVCGAVVAARSGRPEHLDALRPVLTLIEVPT